MQMCENCAYYKAKPGSFRKTCCRREIENEMEKNGAEWIEPPTEECFNVWVNQQSKIASKMNEDFSEDECAYLIRLANTLDDIVI